ncbi:MAG: isoprenylcysteine carboxylmethyltransferase family protein [Ahrensia sp.]|nr:isoprenylcysteine carboxylmethyltransferase family protein [Ahrensia sp.]
MPIDLKLIILAVGLLAGSYMLAILTWSIIRPDKRLWPPKEATDVVKLRVWAITILIFTAAFVLGVMDWNRLEWPSLARWGIGLPLIVVGNLVVWRGVHLIGMAATSGEATGLKTDGLYKWSRNPQYVADIAILIGWGILSASFWGLPVLVIGIAVLMVAPVAEELWLEENYGESYRVYRSQVRRYL